MNKHEGIKKAAPFNKTRKEDLNRVRGTIEFMDPEKGPTHKSKMTDTEGNKK